jgi:hypothetical protein
MILHHLPTDYSPTLYRSWVVDNQSLTLARITLSDDLFLKIEAVKPADHDAPIASKSLEPFSPSTLAGRILKNVRDHINPGIKLKQVSVVEQTKEAPLEYMDFYELDSDGISIMHTSEPVFIAEYDGDNWIIPGPFRCRIDISAEGWAYFFTEAFEELRELNALQPLD